MYKINQIWLLQTQHILMKIPSLNSTKKSACISSAVSPKSLFPYNELIKYGHIKRCKFYSMWFVECSKDKCYDINTNFKPNYLWLSMQKL